MAHNLNEVNEKVAFASTEKAWHGLGQIVDSPMNVETALKLGGLDYTVEKQKLYSGESKDTVQTHMATVRNDTNEILGVVGSDYKVIQNQQAFEFFDHLTGQSNNVQIQTVGALGKGERIFITAKLPHDILVGRDDLTEMYVVLTNSHDGSKAITAGLTPVRVVCQNTLKVALGSLKSSISVRHTLNAQQNLNRAGEMLAHSLKYQKSLEEVFDILYRRKVGDNAAQDLIRQIMTAERIKETPVRDNSRLENVVSLIEEIYHTGVGQSGIVGTYWGVFNSITQYTSHRAHYKNEATKFDSLLMGGNSEKTNSKAIQLLLNQ